MTFLVSKLMKYFFWWFVKVSQKYCVVYRSFNYPSRIWILNTYFFMQFFFCHEKCLICLNIFLFLTGAFLLKTERIVFLKLYISFLSNLPVFFIRLIFIIVNFFYKCGSYYLRFKLLKFHFEFCYCQQMKIRNASLKIITMLKVTGFVCKY